MKVCSKCLRPVNENAVSGWFKYRCHKCLKDFGFYSSDVTDVLICPYCGEKQLLLDLEGKHMSRHCDNCEKTIGPNTEFYRISIFSAIDEPTESGVVKHCDEVNDLCERCGLKLFSLAGLHPFIKDKIPKDREDPAEIIHIARDGEKRTICGVGLYGCSDYKPPVYFVTEHTRQATCPECVKKFKNRK